MRDVETVGCGISMGNEVVCEVRVSNTISKTKRKISGFIAVCSPLREYLELRWHPLSPAPVKAQDGRM